LRRPGEAGFFGAGEVVFECHVADRRVRLPRAALVDGNLAALTLFQCGREVAHRGPANPFGIIALPAVLHDGEAARLQLIDVPEIATAAVLVEPEDEMIVTATGNLGFSVALRQKPYVAAIICRAVLPQQFNLEVPRLRLPQCCRWTPKSGCTVAASTSSLRSWRRGAAPTGT
jgi:hypothetical protein